MNFENPSYDVKRGMPKDTAYEEYREKKDDGTLKLLFSFAMYSII